MNKIENTINKMKDFIKEIEDETLKYSEKLSEEGKKQANELADKTISTINISIEKLNSMKETITDDTNLDEFLQRLEDKCKDVTEFTKVKINEITPNLKDDLTDIKLDIEKGFNDLKEDLIKIRSNPDSSLNKILENENVKNAAKVAKAFKDKAVDFYNDPKTQKAINNAKIKTVELAEKGLNGLKSILKNE